MTTPAVVQISGDSSQLQAALKASAQAMKVVEAETAAMGSQFQQATTEIGKTADALNNKLSGGKSAAGLTSIKAESGKLSDMLKQVAKDADLAAGGIVNGMGGVSAIKAAGAIGLGITGVTTALTGFNSMAVAAFQRYGDEGNAAASKVSKAFDELMGVFTDAVVGQSNVTQAGDMLAGAWKNVKDAATFALAPIKLLTEGFFKLTSSADDNTGAVDDNAAALKALQKVQGTTAESVAKTEGKIAAATRIADERLGRTIKIRRENYEAQTKEITAGITHLDAIGRTNIALERYKINVDELGKTNPMALVMGRDEKGNILPELSANIMNKSMAEANDLIKDRTVLLKALTPEQQMQYITLDLAARKTFDSVLATEAQTKAVNDQAAAERQADAERRARRASAASEPAAPVLGAEGEIVVDAAAVQRVAKAYDAIGEAIANATTNIQEYTANGELALAREDAVAAAILGIHKGKNKGIVEADAEANKKMDEAMEERLGAAAKAGYKSMMMQIGQSKTLAEAATSAIGGVVSALGDEFMIRSSAAYLAADPVAGTGYLALAGGAYALAGALGSKKGPVADAPATASAGKDYGKTENTTYSLRVDAQFADGESISRRFAQMHEGARQRGLIAVPA